jgi:hypothetical protein
MAFGKVSYFTIVSFLTSTNNKALQTSINSSPHLQGSKELSRRRKKKRLIIF